MVSSTRSTGSAISFRTGSGQMTISRTMSCLRSGREILTAPTAGTSPRAELLPEPPQVLRPEPVVGEDVPGVGDDALDLLEPPLEAVLADALEPPRIELGRQPLDGLADLVRRAEPPDPEDGEVVGPPDLVELVPDPGEVDGRRRRRRRPPPLEGPDRERPRRAPGRRGPAGSTAGRGGSPRRSRRVSSARRRGRGRGAPPGRARGLRRAGRSERARRAWRALPRTASTSGASQRRRTPSTASASVGALERGRSSGGTSAADHRNRAPGSPNAPKTTSSVRRRTSGPSSAASGTRARGGGPRRGGSRAARRRRRLPVLVARDEAETQRELLDPLAPDRRLVAPTTRPSSK